MSNNEIDRRAERMSRPTSPFIGTFVALVLVVGAVVWAMDGFAPVTSKSPSAVSSDAVTNQGTPPGAKPAPNPMAPAPQAP